MAGVKRLKFLVQRGYGGLHFAAGAEADVPEPWASHFLNNGSAELVGGKAKEKPVPQPVEEDKPKAKATKAGTLAKKKK